MLFYLISSAINAATSIILGVFVYFQNRKSNINKYFGLFAFSVAFWSIGYFFWHLVKKGEDAIILLRLLMAGAIFIPILYLHFVGSLINILGKIKPFLILGYLLALIFLFFDIFTNYFISSVSPKLFFPFWPNPGLIFHFFLLTFFGYVFFAWYLLISASKKAEGVVRDQLLYVFWGTFIGFIGGSTNYFLWYDVDVPPAGNWAVAVYIAMIAYAIVRKKLFNIKIILTELLVALTAILLFINIFASRSSLEYGWKSALFIAFAVFGYLLIKSVSQEIKRREELETVTGKLEKTYEELKKLDKAKTEFLSIASHQLRTPLTAIKGYISMILEKSYGPVSKKIVKPLKNVFLSNQRLVKLVNDLLNLSRIESGRIEMEMEKASLEELIAGVLEEMKNVAEEKELYLKLEKPKASLPKISVDKEKLRQAVLNLVDNAIRYTEKGGITVKLQITNNKLQITVSDTGTGIEQKELAKMFESFSRGTAGGKLYTEGLGLGLYIAKKFVEMHKGRIWAESEGKGEGSAFIVELPY